MEQDSHVCEGQWQLDAARSTQQSRFKLATIAGAAALALTLGACSGGGEILSDANGPTPPTSNQIAMAGDGETGVEAQPTQNTRPSTSLVDLPLDDEEPALNLDELPELEEPELTEREVAVAQVQPEVENLTSEQESLDALSQSTSQAVVPARPTGAERDGYTRNDAGQLMILDNPASLACADVEIGLTAIDDGDITNANSHISSASIRASSSESGSIASWSDSLANAAELNDSSVAVLVGFIAVCAEGGYEI